MKSATAIGVICALILAPCFAGDLENGIKAHERKDFTHAVSAFERAAAHGNAEAQRRLGFMYYHGEGLRQDNDVVEAAKWWTLAMMQGGKWAETIRPSVESAESKLTAGEIAEGKRRAADWAWTRN